MSKYFPLTVAALFVIVIGWFFPLALLWTSISVSALGFLSTYFHEEFFQWMARRNGIDCKIEVFYCGDAVVIYTYTEQPGTTNWELFNRVRDTYNTYLIPSYFGGMIIASFLLYLLPQTTVA